MKTFATIAITAALLASTATADTTRDLAECYYDRSLMAVGVDPETADKNPLLRAAANEARISMYKTALSAVTFMEKYDNVDLLNAAATMGSDDPAISKAFIECHEVFFPN